MSDDTVSTEPVPPSGGVRWRRFAASLAVAGAGAAGMVLLTAQGVLGAQFAISGMPFVVTADKLDGTGFEQFATLDQMIEDSPNQGDTGGQVVVLVSAIDRAELTNLCQSINLGGMYMKLTAGTGSKPVTARTMVVDSDEISGNASFQSIDIGQDASTLDKVPGVRGNPGVFGQQADKVTITGLRQNNYATTAAVFTLPNLRMSFSSEGC
ncbi:DUF6230 family protein [Micromonospora carbonacea]|jgi:hypothetical protein|uniref:Cholesterol esterase n=1 Tax=Micromonospora carbonacea TaxID=47853 RepID=A0A1C4X498_9ACTN|nr:MULTISPECIES: DUF6230 family protein [Micromonospora]MBB5825491.1 hypothetical protein [Micromonospora carbonacea]MDG4814255.1 DUF6230 family protein [Micromonospora sp. WMMD956]QLD26463.1 cholesterol esterase [Micromonospora carbonacea]WFE56926.1 DUF6230 family protein [Micromonospora sp. WMMD712]SCF03285.1 hypothetical protein GA0070563_104223 [Micromonospora carbonacea]